MLTLFEHAVFWECKSQIFILGYLIAGCGDRNGCPGRRSFKLGTQFLFARS